MTSIETGLASQSCYEAAGTSTGNAPEQHLNPTNRHATADYSQRACSKARIISQIKQAIANLVSATGKAARMKNSDYLSHTLKYDYSYLANLFSQTTGSTIEQYIIEFKIERVKELLVAGELNLTQISYRLNYSSVAHLSNQFKKATGQAPSAFKILHCNRSIIHKSGNDATVFCNRVNAIEVQRVSFAT